MNKPTTAILFLTLLALPAAVNAAVYTFTGGALTIADSSAANPYPSSILVSGIPLDETVVDINITITNISHPYINDVGCVIGSPGGKYVTLFDGTGSEGSVLGQVWVFDDSAAGPIPVTEDPTSGSWQPNDEYGTSLFPVPVPAGPSRPLFLSAFNENNPNGTWALYVADFTGGDAGTIGNWSVTIITVPEPGTAVFCGALAVAAGMRRRRKA